MTLEMGKTLRSAIEESAKCATGCRYYARARRGRFSATSSWTCEGETGYVAFQPIGVVLAIMPWNFPFWQVIRFAAPALCAGNVGLLKHASNVPQCALALEELFADAGAPDGVFQTLLIGSDAIPALLDDDRVAAATLTGSEHAGSEVAARAGQRIKKTVLELGRQRSVRRHAERRHRACGDDGGEGAHDQQRPIVHRREAFHRARATSTRSSASCSLRHTRDLVVGDPMDERTDVGPLATSQIRDDLDGRSEDSVRAGARLLTGGKPRSGTGFFYEPTVLVDVPPDSPAYREEVFGPVAALIRARDIDDAIRIANSTRFGLGASAWTSEGAEARSFVRELQAGSVFINGMVASDPRFPFGGVKASGYGRELSEFGLREFVNIKTVRIAGEQKGRAASRSSVVRSARREGDAHRASRAGSLSTEIAPPQASMI